MSELAKVPRQSRISAASVVEEASFPPLPDSGASCVSSRSGTEAEKCKIVASHSHEEASSQVWMEWKRRNLGVELPFAVKLTKMATARLSCPLGSVLL